MGRNGKDSKEKKNNSKEVVDELLTEVSKKGKSLLNTGWKSARHAFEEKADVFKEKASELSDKSVDEVADEAKHYIRQHPFQSIGLVLGLGILLGFILKSD